MSKLSEKIKFLQEEEKRLERETRKVAFLNHILTSTREYNDQAFEDVKADVIELLEAFVQRAVEQIEGTTTSVAPSVQSVDTSVRKTEAPVAKVDTVGIGDKLSFALDNSHLGGKRVTVANDKNLTIVGKVVGLDAPFVIVETETGPTIKVPLDKVSLA